jgi:hypothetical protein
VFKYCIGNCAEIPSTERRMRHFRCDVTRAGR